MCLIPGIANGHFLDDEAFLTADRAVEVPPCGHTGHAHPLAHEDGDAGLSRRELIGRGGRVAAGAALASAAIAAGTSAVTAGPATADPAPKGKDYVRFLGINGGPVLSATHSQPALEIVVNDTQYLVDCGGDTARQIVNAGETFTNLSHVFLTHHHFDHTAGLAELTTLGWAHTGSPFSKLTIWGPPPVEDLLSHIIGAYEFGAHLFEVGVGYPPWKPELHARTVTMPRRGIKKVFEDDNVIVHGTRVFHGPEVHNAYAYRFTIKSTGRSVTFSGDTAEPNQDLIALADGTDLLIHEAQMDSLIPAIVQSAAPAMRTTFRHHLETTHTNVLEVPRVAKAAGAKRFSFCHYSLSQDTKEFVAKAKPVARRIAYRGEIIGATEGTVLTV